MSRVATMKCEHCEATALCEPATQHSPETLPWEWITVTINHRNGYGDVSHDLCGLCAKEMFSFVNWKPKEARR